MHLWSTLKEYEKFKIKLPPVLGAIPLPIWSSTCHYHMFVYPPVPTHMHQSVRTDCINIFVSSVKICECFPKMKVQSSKFSQWIQWFYKNIWFKERSKIENQNPQALKVKWSHASQNFTHQHKVMHSFPSGKVKLVKHVKIYHAFISAFKVKANHRFSCIQTCIHSKNHKFKNGFMILWYKI